MFPKILIMSTNEQNPLSQPTSAVLNTLGKKQISQDMDRHVSDAALREYCDRNYHQLLPIIAEKVHHEKVQQEKLKAVKARLNFEEVSQYFELGTPSRRMDLRKRLGSRRIRSVSRKHEPRRGRPETPWKRDPKRKMVFKRLEKVADILRVVTRAPTQEEKSLPLRNSITKEYPHTRLKLCQKAKVAQEDTESQGQKSKGQALRLTNYPNHGYARKLIPSLPTFVILISQKGPACQVTSKHMTKARIQKITSRSSRQRKKWNKKCIKDPVENHHIKQIEGEYIEDFVRRFNVESQDVKGASKIIRILVFMHGITNPKLIRRLHDKIPKSVDEMMRITTSFLGGRWQLVTKSERSHFRHGNNRRSDISRISRKEVLKISKGQSGDKIGGVLTLRSSKIIPIECAVVSRPEGQPLVAHQAIEERIKKPMDMIGVPRHIAEHQLNIREGCPPVRKKKRSQAIDRNQTIQEEVEKLIGAGAEFTYALRFRFEATNNEAEYKALIVGLRIEKEMGVKNLQENVDSRLVANQVNGTYIAKEADMIRNEDTPFSLKYGTEAVIPAEIGMPTLRTAKVDMVKNNEALEINLDLLEERREQAAIREAKSKEKMEKYYKSKVHCTSFKPGDLVYH
nr:reverse transcriptase domain-containing protein [Tanacetum cinerariifolium]